MVHYSDTHLVSASDTTCTEADTWYPMQGDKLLHANSGDWSLASDNRLEHHHRDEVYRCFLSVALESDVLTNVEVAVGHFRKGASGVVILDDIKTLSTAAAGIILNASVSGVIEFSDPPISQLELYIRSSVAGAVITVHTLAFDMFGLKNTDTPFEGLSKWRP